jgi:hypothetical protein
MIDTTYKPGARAEILVEAESFEDYGGWILDSQFEDQMGSPYLLAHGLGQPVENARTTIDIHEAGEYKIWVRAKDWVPSHHPGRFKIFINGKTLDTEFGANGQDWMWQPGEVVELPQGKVPLALQDLTGFDGRCDAIFLSRDKTVPPEKTDEAAPAWRKRLLRLSDEPVETGDFDLVVVGGGVAGCAATLSAARLGCRVALINDRPYLGGNASKEIGLGVRGEKGPLIEKLTVRASDGDLQTFKILEAEPNVSIFLEHRVCCAVVDGARIVSVNARHARTGQERRLCAPVFVDCTGMAIVGLLAGAETRFGQESRFEFNETLAPEDTDSIHHGNTVLFRTRTADRPVPFPDVPWALTVAKDYADLGGQLEKPGKDNRQGPFAGKGKAPLVKTADGTFWENPMDFPATHFWEYGQWLDPYAEGERIRDHLFCAIYGTFANVKRLEPEKYANLKLDWVGHVPAHGEYRRLVGDYILTENDIRSHKDFPDTVVLNSDAFCLHYPGHKKYDFRLKDWKWITRDERPYSIPFRCLYSRNISNLMMGGKHISVTHVAGSSTKMTGNGGQHGIAVGAAALLCKKYNTTPRGVYETHIRELQGIIKDVAG